eukprot:gene12040-28245_t
MALKVCAITHSLYVNVIREESAEKYEKWFERTSSMPTFSVDVPFPTARLAEIAYKTLSVDREPHKNSTKTMSVADKVLSMRIETIESKVLRVAVGNFLDMLALTLETMDSFDPQNESVLVVEEAEGSGGTA